MTNVRILLTIVIQSQVIAFARRIAKESIVISVCQIHTDGSIKRVANCVTVIILDRLVNRVTYTPGNVCVAKDSQVVNVTAVRLAILAIRVANDVDVIVMDHLSQITADRFHVMMKDSVHVNHSQLALNANNVLNQRLDCLKTLRKAVQDVSVSDDQMNAHKVTLVGA